MKKEHCYSYPRFFSLVNENLDIKLQVPRSELQKSLVASERDASSFLHRSERNTYFREKTGYIFATINDVGDHFITGFDHNVY
jgi:hypothetical protein